jgi:hypothetical protein
MKPTISQQYDVKSIDDEISKLIIKVVLYGKLLHTC